MLLAEVSYGIARNGAHSNEQLASQVRMTPVPAGCPAAPPIALPVTVEYRAYIPYDNVTGSSSLACIALAKPLAVYLGDSPLSTGPSGTPLTYRASVFSIVTPNSPTPVLSVVQDTGISFQFSPPSPVHPPFITTDDYSSVPGTCKRLNATKQAQFGKNGNSKQSNQLVPNGVALNYTGTIANPLAAQVLSIGWNVTTTVIEASATNTANIKVTGSVTCFPAHEVIVNGQQVAYYHPASSEFNYVANCLLGPASYPMSGPATGTSGLNITF